MKFLLWYLGWCVHKSGVQNKWGNVMSLRHPWYVHIPTECLRNISNRKKTGRRPGKVEVTVPPAKEELTKKE